jgi:uncharacterized Tic20 family protein
MFHLMPTITLRRERRISEACSQTAAPIVEARGTITTKAQSLGAGRKIRDNPFGLRDDELAIAPQFGRKGDVMSGPQAPPAALPVPTQDERSMAMLVHIIGIFTGFVGPLILYFVKRDSKFVSFHALQSLFWHLLYAFTVMALVILFAMLFAFILVSHVALHHNPGDVTPPFEVVFMFPLFWIAIMLCWMLNLGLAVFFAIKANSGEWALYPIVGGWARRAVGV